MLMLMKFEERSNWIFLFSRIELLFKSTNPPATAVEINSFDLSPRSLQHRPQLQYATATAARIRIRIKDEISGL